jgi:hypothetical protein
MKIVAKMIEASGGLDSDPEGSGEHFPGGNIGIAETALTQTWHAQAEVRGEVALYG